MTKEIGRCVESSTGSDHGDWCWPLSWPRPAWPPSAANAVVVVRRSVNYRPVARRPRWSPAAAVATAVAVGTVVRSIPPSCSSVMVGNVAYQQCGNTWYQPRYSGSQVTYVVVNPPR